MSFRCTGWWQSDEPLEITPERATYSDAQADGVPLSAEVDWVYVESNATGEWVKIASFHTSTDLPDANTWEGPGT